MAHTFTITITDEEFKAFELTVEDPDAWVEHAARNKIRKAAIMVAEEHAKNPSEYLTAQDRQAVQDVMVANGDVMKSPKDWSIATLREIIQRTSMPRKADQEPIIDPPL